MDDNKYKVTVTLYSVSAEEDPEGGSSAQTFVIEPGVDMYFKQPSKLRALSFVVDKVEVING